MSNALLIAILAHALWASLLYVALNQHLEYRRTRGWLQFLTTP